MLIVGGIERRIPNDSHLEDRVSGRSAGLTALDHANQGLGSSDEPVSSPNMKIGL